MQKLFLDTDKIELWNMFNYKWNQNIVVWKKTDWLFILDIEYDPEFNSEENPILFISYSTLEEDLLNNYEIDLRLFTTEVPMEFIQD